jgi:hypothetical protein
MKNKYILDIVFLAISNRYEINHLLKILCYHFRSQIHSMSLLTPLPSISTLSDNLIIYSSGSIPIAVKELNLKQTLLGGQSFRYSHLFL